MNGIVEAAAELQEWMVDSRQQFCLIGGLAVIRWGEHRGTQDVDVSVFVGFGEERIFAESLLQTFEPRIDDAAQFAESSRVVLARASNGVDLDVVLAGFPFEEAVIKRSSPWQVSETVSLRTAAAEDLIVLKAFAGRDRDWGDVRGILRQQKGLLNVELVVLQLNELCHLTGDVSPVERLQEMLAELA